MKTDRMEQGVFYKYLVAALLISGCGVKGKPQPPLENPQIGRGSYIFSESGKRIKFDSPPGKKKPQEKEEDWDEARDFDEVDE